MAANIPQQTLDYILGLVRNQTGTASGSLLPPTQQVGLNSIPVVENLRLVRTQPLVGATLYTIQWSEPITANRQIDHYFVTASLPNSPSTIDHALCVASPAVITISGTYNPGQIIVFTIQTVLKNGATSLRASSPSCTGSILQSAPVLPTTTKIVLINGTTWIAPSSVISPIIVECVGGGGSGHGSTLLSDSPGGGGGGAYARRNTLAVTPGNTYTYTIGLGGIANTGAGPSGGNTTFTGDSQSCIAAGGTGGGAGSGGAGGTVGASTGDITFAGGAGSFVTNKGGGGGASGGSASTGTAASGATGGTLVAGGGPGANAPSVGGTGNHPSVGPGGGGSGAYPNGSGINGGNGFNGNITITYTYN